jgi:hypothetical protein
MTHVSKSCEAYISEYQASQRAWQISKVKCSTLLIMEPALIVTRYFSEKQTSEVQPSHGHGPNL